MHATEALSEADRLMTICNSCRYCEGLCAVFQAMELRRSFVDGDLNYLANLCHSCGACYVDCQFSPPHQFNVNVPLTFARVRTQSYEFNAFPSAFAPLFAHNGLAVSLVAALCMTVFVAGFVAWHDPAVLFSTHTGAGAFYRLMPHNAMVLLFGAVFAYAIVALAMSVRKFWGSIEGPANARPSLGSLWAAMKDAGRLRYLDGGGDGCFNDEAKPDRRRLYHHFTFYGFMLCFASTTSATAYHYLFGQQAPYAWYEPPVLLGSLGGIGLLIGPVGLLAAKWRRDPALQEQDRFGMDAAFLAMLFLTSLTGFALLIFRATPAMGLLLAAHLGVVFALFLTMPYGKFVHGIYRYVALVKFAQERNCLHGDGKRS